MSAYLIYSRDPYLAEIFLESQISKVKPKQVLKYSFKAVVFKNLAEKIFNFSLFEGKRIYFLENAEVLKDSDISFIAKLDFRQLEDIFIFHLESKIYWKILPRWENIRGLEIKELKLSSESSIKNYLERVANKTIPWESISYIIQVYKKNQNFKEIKDAVLKASLYSPERKEIDNQVLKDFLELKEPPEIKYLYQMLKRRDLRNSLEVLLSLKEKGYKEEHIFSSLVSRIAKEATPEEAEFIIYLERKFKTGKGEISFLLLQLFFFYCETGVLKTNLFLSSG